MVTARPQAQQAHDISTKWTVQTVLLSTRNEDYKVFACSPVTIGHCATTSTTSAKQFLFLTLVGQMRVNLGSIRPDVSNRTSVLPFNADMVLSLHSTSFTVIPL